MDVSRIIRGLTRLAVFPLLAYSGLLVVSATPTSLRTEWNKGMIDAAQSTLWRARIRAGREVFEGERIYTRVTRRFCLVVTAEDLDGKHHVLHEDYPGCVPPRVRVFNDLWNLVLYSTIGRTTAHRLAIRRNHAAQVRRLQTLGSLDGISAYFCDHPPAGAELGVVWMSAYTETGTYADGEIESRHDVIHAYDCVDRRRRVAGNLVARFDEDGVVRVEPRPAALQKRGRE